MTVNFLLALLCPLGHGSKDQFINTTAKAFY